MLVTACPLFVCFFVFLGFLFSTVKVASITAMIFFHIILHPAVLIGNFHIFITSLNNKCIINSCNSKFNGMFSLIRFSDTFYLVVSKHFFIPLIFLLDVSPPPHVYKPTQKPLRSYILGSGL